MEMERNLTEDLRQWTEEIYDELVSLRHEIHMHPEIGFEEVRTSALVRATLKKYGIPHTTMAKTGVVGLVEGTGPGRTVLLRGDMDALVLQEEAEVPYRSRIANRMHACGHDGHTVGLLGAGILLKKLAHRFPGNVKLMFQPAEEEEGGALPMIEEGILENPKVDAAFGCHLWGGLLSGKAEVAHGIMMGAPSIFHLTITGKGGHGAQPHRTIDPILLSAHVLTMLQTVVSRRMNPLDPGVLTVGSIQGGAVHNVIPNQVHIIGTVRTLKESTMDQMETEMENIIRGVTSAHGASYTFDFQRKYPPLVNDAGMTAIAKEAFQKILGADQVTEIQEPTMGGEDFAFVAKAVPSSFVFVGIAEEEEKPVVHHHPLFQWEDRHLKTLAQGLAQTALDFLLEEA